SLTNGAVYMISSKTPQPPPGPQNVVGVTIVANPGRMVLSAVAAFTDTDPRLTGRDFTAVINWGDATLPARGHVQSAGKGVFVVVGPHRYPSQGTFGIPVQIADNQGHRVVAQSLAIVAPHVIPPTTFNIPPAAPAALRNASVATSGLSTK